MPYSKATLPDWVKKYTPHEQSIWLSSFNNALRHYGKESSAFRVANNAVSEYRKKHKKGGVK